MAIRITKLKDLVGKPTHVLTAADHAQNAQAVMQHYETLDHHHDHEDQLVELLEDLMHWADHHGAEFEYALAAARKRYKDTLKEEDELKNGG